MIYSEKKMLILVIIGCTLMTFSYFLRTGTILKYEELFKEDQNYFHEKKSLQRIQVKNVNVLLIYTRSQR